MPLPTIGIFIPQWLTRSDKSDKYFAEQLLDTIYASGRYRAIAIDLEHLVLTDFDQAQDFCREHNLVAVLNHHSHYYSSSGTYARTTELLAQCVPFFNSRDAHRVGHNKAHTKQMLREQGIPVLDDVIVSTLQELREAFRDGQWHVVKPLSGGGGMGVRLLRERGGGLSELHYGYWHNLTVRNGTGGVWVRRDMTALSAAVSTVFVIIGAGLLMKVLSVSVFLALLLAMLYIFLNRYDAGCTYRPMLVERYFNDEPRGFASLRCTVIGGEVVEAVKRINPHNITSNVSNGGVAYAIELTEYQKEIAVAATKVIGADYAGVDMLVYGGETVIGEINIGPITVFCKKTGVNVGKLLGEYLVKKCDEIGVS